MSFGLCLHNYLPEISRQSLNVPRIFCVWKTNNETLLNFRESNAKQVTTAHGGLSQVQYNNTQKIFGPINQKNLVTEEKCSRTKMNLYRV
jgi:hypothetical protein